MELWRPKKCNCLVWALVMRRRYGGKIIQRPSFAGWWKHVFWSPDGVRFFDYSPIDEYALNRKTPPILYSGQARQVLSETLIQAVIIDGLMLDYQIEIMPKLN